MIDESSIGLPSTTDTTPMVCLAVAEAIPAEYYNFKPNPEEMS